MKKPGLTLAVSHNIYLTREQRYALADGNPVDVQGVSLPIWYFKGQSSEPGVEVFNTYTLLHDPKSEIDIDQQKTGYVINVPVEMEPTSKKEVPAELWDSMNEEQKEKFLADMPTGTSLRDLKDGGSGMLAFNQYNKSHIKGMTIHVLHYIRIAGVEELVNSLV